MMALHFQPTLQSSQKGHISPIVITKEVTNTIAYSFCFLSSISLATTFHFMLLFGIEINGCFHILQKAEYRAFRQS